MELPANMMTPTVRYLYHRVDVSIFHHFTEWAFLGFY